jgi:hypothetical protein
MRARSLWAALLLPLIAGCQIWTGTPTVPGAQPRTATVAPTRRPPTPTPRNVLPAMTATSANVRIASSASEFSCEVAEKGTGQAAPRRRLFVKGNKVRLEWPMPAGQAVLVVDGDAQRAASWIVGQKQVTQQPFAQAQQQVSPYLDALRQTKELSKGTVSAHDAVGGEPCLVYRGNALTLCVSAAGIPLRIQRRTNSGESTQEWLNVLKGNVPDSLFASPGP